MTSEPYTPQDVPPDTDEYIYRYVTKSVHDAQTGVPVITSVLTKIGISQP